MIHPSYVELMKVVNNNVEIGEEPVVNSRYSIVIAAASLRSLWLYNKNTFYSGNIRSGAVLFHIPFFHIK